MGNIIKIGEANLYIMDDPRTKLFLASISDAGSPFLTELSDLQGGIEDRLEHRLSAYVYATERGMESAFNEEHGLSALGYEERLLVWKDGMVRTDRQLDVTDMGYALEALYVETQHITARRPSNMTGLSLSKFEQLKIN